MDGDSSMIKVEATKKEDGTVECAYEVGLECSNCGMAVDTHEYESGTCSDCGEQWDEKRHIGIYVTSIPMSGKTR
jgi:rRNA maturation endonuclease Nob1